MTWADSFRTAYEAILARRMRSILTMLGILIGIAAVMLTVGLGQGAQERVASAINALGSNLLIVTPGSTTSSSGFRGGQGSASRACTYQRPSIRRCERSVNGTSGTVGRRRPEAASRGPPNGGGVDLRQVDPCATPLVPT